MKLKKNNNKKGLSREMSGSPLFPVENRAKVYRIEQKNEQHQIQPGNLFLLYFIYLFFKRKKKKEKSMTS